MDMYKADQAIIEYAKDIYNANFFLMQIRNYKYLKIKSGADVFKINLSDKERFGYYTAFHQNRGPSEDGTIYYHVQLKSRNLDYIIFRCVTHGFNKENEIPYMKEDWYKFKEDAIRYKMN